MTLDAVTLEMIMGERALSVRIKAAEEEIFRALYQFGDEPPTNPFRDQGFSGLIYVSDARAQAADQTSHQLFCSWVPRSDEPDRESDHRARREAEADARRSALFATLSQTEPCTLTEAQRQAGALCPPKHPLQARAQAIVALHQMGQRQFMDVTLDDAQLAGADLRETYFQAVSFARANLSDAALYSGDMRFAMLEGANLQRANLYSVNLRSANLRNADISGGKLEGCELESADLRGANLSGAYLASADLDGANLSGANLKGAIFANASLNGANLEGANLEGARNLTQAQLDNTYGDSSTRLPSGFRLRGTTPVAVPAASSTPQRP